MIRCRLFTAVLVVGTTSIATAGPLDLKTVAVAVLSDDAGAAAAAIEHLRSAGPEGLAALIDAHRGLLEGVAGLGHRREERWSKPQSSTAVVAGLPTEPRLPTEGLLNGGRPAVGSPAGSGDPRRSVTADRVIDSRYTRLKSALDAVGAQHDCDTSRLYWYTDLTSAIDAARREGKPILSLRLLGKLTDEFSCANSRYFRTSLYANREIGDYLRNRFVLHWQTFRAVPRVTIDYGDGRKLEQTLTGNSIHYVLDADGRPFDALPGLYGPQAFLRELKSIEGAVARTAALDDTAGNAFFVNYHQQRLKSIETHWQRDLATLNISAPALVGQAATPVAQVAVQKKAGAVRAGALARGKGASEFPVLNGIALTARDRFRWATDDVWSRIGALHQHDALLDDASVALIRRQNPTQPVADQPNGQSQFSQDALSAMVQAFQVSMAVDTVRNEYELHRQLHEWFASGIDRDLETLNERVYAELFLTPRSDPWLGLVSPEVYTGLEGGGRRE